MAIKYRQHRRRRQRAGGFAREELDSFLFWKFFYRLLRDAPVEFFKLVLSAGAILFVGWLLICFLAIFS